MLSHLARVTKASHFFKLNDMSDRIKQHVYAFLRKYMDVDTSRSNPNSPNPQPPKVTIYADGTKDHSEFRFHANNYPKFIAFMEQQGIHEKDLNIKVLDTPAFDPYTFDVRPGWIPKENQVSPIAYLTADNGPRSRFIGLQTGQGKGFITLKTLSELAGRTIVIVRPKFVEKWRQELMQILDLTEENIMEVAGSGDLKAFLAMCEYPELMENIGVVIISNKTILPWLKLYAEFKDETRDLGYACMPEELFAHARAKVRVVDEVHLDFHLNHRIDMHTNVFRAISLSASLIDDDPFTEKMQRVAYPVAERFNGGALKKYIAAHAVLYYHDPDHKVRTSEFGSSTYSHTAYEKSIMRSSRFFANYAKMICRIIQAGYVEDMQPGDRCIVFASTIEMCTRLVEYIKVQFPQFDTRRFAEKDPEENLLLSDIRVTTPGSGGTGHDIKQLTCNILTVGLKSTKMNIQILGRERELPGRIPRFYYTSCHDVKKHNDYHIEKEKLMGERALSFKTIPYNERV